MCWHNVKWKQSGRRRTKASRRVKRAALSYGIPNKSHDNSRHFVSKRFPAHQAQVIYSKTFRLVFCTPSLLFATDKAKTILGETLCCKNKPEIALVSKKSFPNVCLPSQQPLLKLNSHHAYSLVPYHNGSVYCWRLTWESSFPSRLSTHPKSWRCSPARHAERNSYEECPTTRALVFIFPVAPNDLIDSQRHWSKHVDLPSAWTRSPESRTTVQALGQSINSEEWRRVEVLRFSPFESKA